MAYQVHAGLYSCEKGDVRASCQKLAWEVGGNALYLKQIVNFIESAGVNTAQLFNVDAGWGFQLEGRYPFGSVNDLTLN